ncbi:GNAT family N-acetyltransferase [Paenibacillus macquariensis]|uniref:Acetyltransferase (GNAT) family protein n=1 Tax=Paenibacillus macquariensis TaxID=948756 RepID=A0ABY1JMP4_9BACL|nr:GNAT family N-acetyltransferase [Paenibacillus macquariensis]MEC0092282.1 GNAT family N-acetyltransferase [Paenibacillus macquariensis]OAB37175.1 GCN5 family acetyltransferase [Paenibacillus macquariensis subsp. macquariensis]SIQ47083.1 Acetyltransferase (GNAT) family protein [Paenibacillus macquariensis]
MSKKIEEYSLNAWPALQTLIQDGWLLRFADGYTKRSNSINAIYHGIDDNLDRKIMNCEQIYSRAGQDIIFKITPFVPESLDQVLECRGYGVLDLSSVQTLDSLTDIKVPSITEMEISECLNDKWLDTMSEMNGLSDRMKSVTRKLLTGSKLRQGYCIVYVNAVPVACGLGVVEGDHVGLYDIVTDRHYRNKGYGEQLILHILHWAKSIGATKSYLLVVKNNTAAIQCYKKLNYEEQYTYWYRHK